MKKTILTLILAILTPAALMAQEAVIQWQKSYDGAGDDRPTEIQKTIDGGYILAGYTFFAGNMPNYHYSADYLITKIDDTGGLQWQKCFGGFNFDCATSVQQAGDGGYIIAGTTMSNDGDVSGNHGLSDYWIVKLNDTGAIQWQKCFGGSGYDSACAIRQTIDGGYIVAGSTTSNDGEVSGNHSLNSDCWIVKLDDTGEIEWQKCLGGSFADYAYDIRQTADKGYILSGKSNSVDGDISNLHGAYDYLVIKLDSAGGIQWQKCLGGTSVEAAVSIKQTLDGGYILAGYTFSSDGDVSLNHGMDDGWIVRLNDQGDIQWKKSLGGASHEQANGIIQTTNGGYIVAGTARSSDGDVVGNHGAVDIWVLGLDDTGSIQWQRCIGGSDNENVASILQSNDGNFVLLGNSLSNDGDNAGNGLGNYWAIKLTIFPETVRGNTASQNNISISPNPSNGHFSITMPDNAGDARLSVMNTLGQRVLYKELKGNNAVVDIPRVPGIYFVKLNAGNMSYNSKLIID